jgi:hypothetical protein
MFEVLGLRSRPAFLPYAAGGETSRSFAAAAPGQAQSQQQAGAQA